MTTAVKLNGQKYREITMLIPWELFLKYESACDRENVKRAARGEPMLNFGDHIQATLIPALQVIVDKIPDAPDS